MKLTEKQYRDPRENENISVEQVIALACELASKALDIYWQDNFPHMEMDKVDKNGEVTGEYTELAQDKFNMIYDDIEGVIVSLMEKHPDQNILKIEALIN